MALSYQQSETISHQQLATQGQSGFVTTVLIESGYQRGVNIFMSKLGLIHYNYASKSLDDFLKFYE